MTTTVDTNMLVFAVHTSNPRQDRARALIEWVAAGPGIVHLFWPALTGFLRLVTHSSIFEHPLHPDVAIAAVDRLISRPHVRVSGETDDFWASYRRIANEVPLRGKVVPDAHLVALMYEHGVTTIWSNDRDMRKFSGITVKDPFAEKYSAGFE